MEDENATWDKNSSYALGLYKRLTRILGIWPLDDHGILSAFKIFIIIVIQLTSVTIFSQNWINKGNCGSIIEIVDVITLMATSLMTVTKILLPWIHQKKLSYIISSALEDWSNVGDEESRNLMRKYAYIGRVVLIVQMVGAYITIMNMMLSKLPNFAVDIELDNRSMPLRNIPIGPGCWISPETSMFIYLLFYFFVCLHLFILATSCVGVDIFSFGLAIHICGQLELLYKDIKKLDDDSDEHIQRKKLARFSKRHTHLLNLMDNFEGAFNMMILLDLGANTFIISISEIVIIWAYKIGNNGLVLAVVVRIYLLYIQIFIYSFIGEKLSSSAEKLQVAIYNCSWYNMKCNIVKDLKFIMMRNNYLFHLTAGKICDMNYENFKNIVKSMFSYFSILRLMFDE